MGIALALAGADVLLTDLPHVTPLARDNVSDNCCSQRIRAQARFRLHVLLQNMREAIKTHHGVLCSDDGANAGLPQVVDYAWGSHVAVLGEPPDIITGADIVYQKEFFPQLVHTLESASAPHTIIYLAFRLRGKHAITFAGLICSLRCSQVKAGKLSGDLPGRGEEDFEAMLADRNFAVERVSLGMFHIEYQGGEYRVLRACKRGG